MFSQSLRAYIVPGGDDMDGGFRFEISKSNELFLGRVSMFSFGTSILLEHFYGNGLLSLLNFETGIPIWETEPVIAAFIFFQIATGLAPAKGSFFPARGEQASQAGNSVQVAAYSENDFLGTLVKEYALLIGNLLGMTKERELLVGRVAQVGLAASLLGEVLTGEGPLNQLEMETGVELMQANPLIVVVALSFFLVALSEGTGVFKDEK